MIDDRCREWGIVPPRWENDEGDFADVIRRQPGVGLLTMVTKAQSDDALLGDDKNERREGRI